MAIAQEGPVSDAQVFGTPAPPDPSGWRHRLERAVAGRRRVRLNAAGQVALTLKRPLYDGIPHLLMSPLEFTQRMAALLSRPRMQLIQFHGALTSIAKLRPRMVPKVSDHAGQRLEYVATVGRETKAA